jgi:hypothetical protein
MGTRSIEEVHEGFSPKCMSIEGVVGTAIGLEGGERVIRVYVTEKRRDIEDEVPHRVEGYRVVIKEAGEMRALDPQ